MQAKWSVFVRKEPERWLAFVAPLGAGVEAWRFGCAGHSKEEVVRRAHNWVNGQWNQEP